MLHLRKPTIVFVSSAFHDQGYYDPIVPFLRRTEYLLDLNIKLPSVGNSSASSLQEDADVIRNAVLDVLDKQGGNNVVMVLSSYAAVPAAQGLVGLDQKTRGPGRTAILKFLFLSCNIPRIGESHLRQFGDWTKSVGLKAEPPVTIKDGAAVFTASPDMFYNGLDEEIKTHFYNNLKTQSAATLMTPITQAAYLDIPSWYLLTKLDNIMPRDFQILCTKVIGEKLEKVEEIESGHCCCWTRPDIVVDFILRGARSAEKALLK